MGWSAKFGCRGCFLIGFSLILGCASPKMPVQSVDVALSATQHWRLGLEKAEARDYGGALAEIEAAQKKEPELKYEIALAHLHFLSKDVDGAQKRYGKLISSGQLSVSQQSELESEFARIEKASGKIAGRSLAGQWIRSTAAVIAAEEAIEKKDFDTAYKSYDKAYQYNQDHTLLLESALAASKAEQWQWAYKKFKEYTAVGGNDISRDMLYRIVAETDRIMTLLKGQDVVTHKSLADEIYAERTGEEESDGLPPSMQQEAGAAEKDRESVENSQGESAAVVSGNIEESDDGKILAKEQPINEAEERRLAKAAEREARADARKSEVKERQLAREQKRAAAEADRKERVEKRRLAAKQKKAEQKERLAQRAHKKAEREFALQEKKHAAELKAQTAAEIKEAEHISRVDAMEAKRIASAEDKNAQKSSDEKRERNSATLDVATSMDTTFEDLLFYSSSKSATVRYKAVTELIPLMVDNARVALENRVINDRNMHVRFLAISGLVQRHSVASLSILEHAVMTAATSQERAMLKNAISELRLGGERK